ncbi:MAG: MoaD/ThiS family protein [Gammaproteobacteria bacterium]|nr:MoaD/ThiS family protein [Gammaproteobacteria bacterium]
MKLHLKLYATLAEYLPPGAVSNVAEIDIPESTTPYQVLDLHRVPRARAHLVLVNGVYIPPTRRDEALLKDGDALAIWPPVAGG